MHPLDVHLFDVHPLDVQRFDVQPLDVQPLDVHQLDVQPLDVPLFDEAAVPPHSHSRFSRSTVRPAVLMRWQ